MKKIKYDGNWHLKGSGVWAVWTRYDSIDLCTQKTSDFLNDCVQLCPDCLPFNVVSPVKHYKTTPYSAVPSLAVLRKIIEEGINKYVCNGGYSAFFNNIMNSSDQRRVILIKLTCGAYDRYSNSMSIGFPPYNDEAKHIVTKEIFLASMKLMIKHWNPYRAGSGIEPSMLRDYTQVDDILSICPEVGWLNYFSGKLGELPALPDWVIVTPVEGFGNCIQVSDELPCKIKEKNELHDVIAKVYELSEIIKPWIQSKWEFIVESGL
jgi:hypothetical protein